MTGHDYLTGILRREELQLGELVALQVARGEIEQVLRAVYGSTPRIYYGGSYAKDTQIRSAYDLDIVFYVPSYDTRPLKDLFVGVRAALVLRSYAVQPKTVALRVQYKAGFHIDVVPGRAQDTTFKYASLYKNPDSWMQTSLKLHIDAIRKSGVRPVVRLMKLWRLQRNVPLTTFAIEILVTSALHGVAILDYASALMRVFSFISTNILTVKLVDPANSNNEVELSYLDRVTTQARANEAIQAAYWSHAIS